MAIISKKLRKNSFVLVETLLALTITVTCIYLVSSSHRFLLQLDKQNDEKILLIRRLYEDVKTFRIYQRLPARKMSELKSETSIESNHDGIQKATIIQGEEIIEIRQE